MEVQQAYRRRSSRWDCRIRYTAIFSLPVCAIPATFAVKPFPRSSPLNGTKSSNTSSPWIARCAPSATRCSGRSTVWTITRASIIVGRNRAGYRRVCSDRAEETLCEKTSLVVEKERKKGRKKEREEKKKERNETEGRKKRRKRCQWTTTRSSRGTRRRISLPHHIVDSMAARRIASLLSIFSFLFDTRLFDTRYCCLRCRPVFPSAEYGASNGIVVNC